MLRFGPDIISGTSAGALAAVLSSCGKSIDDVMKFLAKQGIRKVIGFELPGGGLISLQKLVKLFIQFTGVSTFEELDKPIYIKSHKIKFQENHNFFKTSVIYYTSFEKGRTEVYYDAINHYLLGYRDENKNYALSICTQYRTIIAWMQIS